MIGEGGVLKKSLVLLLEAQEWTPGRRNRGACTMAPGSANVCLSSVLSRHTQLHRLTEKRIRRQSGQTAMGHFSRTANFGLLMRESAEFCFLWSKRIKLGPKGELRNNKNEIRGLYDAHYMAADILMHSPPTNSQQFCALGVAVIPVLIVSRKDYHCLPYTHRKEVQEGRSLTGALQLVTRVLGSNLGLPTLISMVLVASLMSHGSGIYSVLLWWSTVSAP